MKGRRLFRLMIVCFLIAGCLTIPASAIVTYEPNAQIITRATDELLRTTEINLEKGDIIW